MAALRLNRRNLMWAAVASAIAPGMDVPVGARQSAAQDPMRAAEELSQMEVTAHIPALYTFYDRMHPDAQALIPRHVVIRYFTEVFQPRQPQPAIATGVTYKDWTWGVNGETYPNTAEVAFTQEFADGVTSDVVRLVQHDGAWRWFFGRDAAWVEQQVRRFTQTLTVPQAGSVPYQLDRAPLDAGMLNLLPETLDSPFGPARLMPVDDRSVPLPEWCTSRSSLRYEAEDEGYPVGFAQVMTVRDDLAIVTPLSRLVEDLETRPPFTLRGWNLVPANGVPFADVEVFGSDAVGMARSIYWGRADGRYIAVISHVDSPALEAMAVALGGTSEGAPAA